MSSILDDIQVTKGPAPAYAVTMPLDTMGVSITAEPVIEKCVGFVVRVTLLEYPYEPEGPTFD